MTGGRYQRVLCSALWWERKAELIEVRGCCCEWCGADDEEIELHHLSYEHLGDERDDELVLLCVDCHRQAHA